MADEVAIWRRVLGFTKGTDGNQPVLLNTAILMDCGHEVPVNPPAATPALLRCGECERQAAMK